MTQKKASSGTQTVALLIALIVIGVLLYMSFIFFTKFKAYEDISQDLKAKIQSNYNGYLQLNYNTVNNVIRMSDYKYEQTIKTLAGVFSKIDCNTQYHCLINGISYQFKLSKANGMLNISSYQAHLSPDAIKDAKNSFVVAQSYSQQF